MIVAISTAKREVPLIGQNIRWWGVTTFTTWAYWSGQPVPARSVTTWEGRW